MARFTTTRIRMALGTSEETKDVPIGDTLAFVAGMLESIPVNAALFGADDEVSITLTFLGDERDA